MSETLEDLRREAGRRVRDLRSQRGLSVAELARRAGIPRSYVYDLESGRRVSVRNICSVVPVLGTTADYLLCLSDTDDRTHSCCEVAADRDAWTRFHGDDGLVRGSDGTFRPVRPYLKAGSVMEASGGEPIRLVQCGVYEFRGEVYRVGEDDQEREGETGS